jgi:hypothetical protein
MSTVTDAPADASVKPGVSPARKKFSTGLLIVALVVLAIEARSGLGQLLSGKALAARSFEGGFENVSFAEASSLVSMVPSVSVHADNPDETVYRYTWFSLLRSIAKKPVPELYIVASKADPPQAVAYFTDREEAALMYGDVGDDDEIKPHVDICPDEPAMPTDPVAAQDNLSPAPATQSENNHDSQAPAADSPAEETAPVAAADETPAESAPADANTPAAGTSATP